MSLLPEGKDNAVTGRMIAQRTGIEYDRVRAVISHLVNRHGRLIASCSGGYFIPVTEDEVREATRSLRHRGIMILYRASRLQRASIEEIFHQSVMEFADERKIKAS